MSKFSLLQNNSNQYNRTSTSNVHEVSEEIAQLQGEVERLDLLTEAMWKLKCDKFGPLIVSIDSYGNNLIENNKIDFNTKREKALEDLKGKLSYME